MVAAMLEPATDGRSPSLTEATSENCWIFLGLKTNYPTNQQTNKHIKINSTTNIDGMKAPPPHHGGDSALMLNKVSVKTPPHHHGGDSAPLSSKIKNRRIRGRTPTSYYKEQARVIKNNIHLFFDASLILLSTIPHHNHQSLLSPTKLHMAGDSTALTTI